MIDILIVSMIAICVIAIMRYQTKKKQKKNCQSGCAGCPLEQGCGEKEK